MSTETSTETSTQQTSTQEPAFVDLYSEAAAKLAEERATREWWALVTGTDKRR